MASYPNSQDPYSSSSSQGFSSYDPKTGVLTSGSQSYSVAPEKASAMLKQVETKKRKKKSRSGTSPYVTPDPYKDAQGTSQALQTPIEIKQAVNSSPGNKSPANTSYDKNSLREAYLRSQAQERPRDPSETLAPTPKVEQTAIRIGIDTREYKTYTGEYLSKEDQRTRDLNEARQSFRDKFLTQTNTAPGGFTGLKEGLILTGTIAKLGRKSIRAGIFKGITNAVKDVVTGQIITNTGEMLTEIATNPRGVAQQLSADFKKNPFQFTGEQVAYVYTLDKIPVVVKKTYQGSKSYLRRYDVAGSRADPLKGVETTGKDFNPGDLDIVTDIQTTIQGQRVNPDLVLKKSPLKLDETNFYDQNARALESGAVVKGNNLVFDDFIKIPESRYPVTGEISVDYGSIRVKAKVRDEKVFGETYVGERTITDFYPNTNAPQYGKPFQDPVSLEIYDPITLEKIGEIKKPKPSEIQKKLNFGKRNIDGTDKYIGANIGLFTEAQKLATEIINEFKPNMRELNPASDLGGSPGSRNPRPPILERPPIFNYKSPYNDLNSPGSLIDNPQTQTPGIIEDNIQLPKPIQDQGGAQDQNNDQGQDQGRRLLTGGGGKRKQDTIIDQIPDTILDQGSRQDREPVTTPIYTPVYNRRLTSITKTKERPRPIIPVIKVKNTSPISRFKGFDVLVRSRGKFKRVNTGALSRIEAINLGAYKVGTTASATFKILPSKLEKTQNFKGSGVLNDFYRKGDLFIEKRSRRIKSLGELQEITYKGIQAQKFKKIF